MVCKFPGLDAISCHWSSSNPCVNSELYSSSSDNGETWSKPSNDISLNTVNQEHQPHLYKTEEGIWYLYYSAFHTDGKLGIFRAKQVSSGDWENWGEKEVVISAGNTAGIGEPSLTDKGDISFVAVYINPKGTKYDKYDSDPWILPKRQL